mmetsp:Transcript_7132/g.5914  ORF Transcript_7132/g.5914 Transcript_7132/m.5914 type:complete len:111 (-) Transcript_7132:84-416(-)
MKRIPVNYNFRNFALVIGDPIDWVEDQVPTTRPILWDMPVNPLFVSMFGTSVSEGSVLTIGVIVLLCLVLLLCALIAFCIYKRKRSHRVAYTSLEMQQPPSTALAVDDEV